MVKKEIMNAIQAIKTECGKHGKCEGCPFYNDRNSKKEPLEDETCGCLLTSTLTHDKETNEPVKYRYPAEWRTELFQTEETPEY